MKTDQLKKYAPDARNRFIREVTGQAAKLGITAKKTEPATVQGDVLMIAGQAFDKSVEAPRSALLKQIELKGFDVTMEAVAYTWFNRLVALRYMELHNYLDHGYRVLSHPENKPQPEIIDHAADVELQGLDRDAVLELKLDGTKDEELYRLLLKAQCNALHTAMPFLFDAIGGETELLLPGNLLHTDSLIRQLVEQIDEELWQEIEIIGWLYQFYISEKKDEVIGKVVKSEDIPAATQLFTPNWIVKYMVQNSLGAQWLATYPQSPLKGQMEYYIEPAEQTDEVNAQLAAITPSQLNPEELTLMDPACGSGHILVEAYDLFKAIYLERGYRQRDVAQLILEKNLFGLDIDQRAAQLSGFALMMKGRADDRRLFERGVSLNVLALMDSAGLDEEVLAKGIGLSDYGLKSGVLTELKSLFEHATTFGSLIQVPEGLAEKLPALLELSELESQDLFIASELARLELLLQQAVILAAQYDVVVANPPFMAGKYINPTLKSFLRMEYRDFSRDIFAAFLVRILLLARDQRLVAAVTPREWMFISSYEKLREWVIARHSISSLVKPYYTSFFESAIVRLISFVVYKNTVGLKGSFFDLGYLGSAESQAPRFLTAIATQGAENKFNATASNFKDIPGSPFAFWASENVRTAFRKGVSFGDVGMPRVGMQTSNNDKYLRRWYEISHEEMQGTGAASPKWIKYLKGGSFRKWYGNLDYVLWFNSDPGFITKQPNATVLPLGRLSEEKCTWSDISSGTFAARYAPTDSFHDLAGHCFYPPNELLSPLLAFTNSKPFNLFISLLSATVHFQVGDVAKVPVLPAGVDSGENSEILVELAKVDWDCLESSWDFQSSPLLTGSSNLTTTLEYSYNTWIDQNCKTIAETKSLEEENNRLFIDAYGLQNELTPEVSIEQITLTVNPAYRYGGKLTEEEQQSRFREDTMEELISYALGCMMGRYSLDEPGLIYANSGNDGFDANRYSTFPADEDGILPLTDTQWFEDDASARITEFLSVSWDKSHLEDNLTFLAANLKPKKKEISRDTIRRYLCDKFFKDHLQTYKKRPIYWLFSSGKKKAFQCLVYLHRYNAGTLARMRSEYVIPLQGKMTARADALRADVAAATSTAERNAAQKELTKLEQQQIELVAFDEKLRHVSDQRIELDLDDGVKVNYGKFGDLLAEVKAVHGKAV